jgi:kynurenine 3-monooxygenase
MFSSIVVGGGLSGLLMAMYLSKMGCQVRVFEKRNIRTSSHGSGRSVNLLLSARGLSALRDFDLEETAKKVIGVPVYGRTAHRADGTTSFVPYSDDGRQAIYICPRTNLNRMLLDEVEQLPNVTLHLGQQCVGVNPDTGTVNLLQTATHRRTKASADLVIGADGTHSVVREHLLRTAPADYEVAALSWCYKELTIQPAGHDSARLDRNMLHYWPRGRHMLFALPNLNDSFNGNLTLPLDGNESVESLRTEDDVRHFFEHHYADVSSMTPYLVNEFLTRKPGMLRTVRTSRWHHRGKVVLVGDACHTVVPYYGQGMNAAFEDCAALAACLSAHGEDRESALAEYAALRRPNTDALAELSLRHLDSLVDPVRHAATETRHRIAVTLNRLARLPGKRLYEMVTHTTTPYAECIAEAARQERRARWLGLGALMACHTAWSRVGSLTRRLFQRRPRLIPHEVGHGS